MANEKKRFSRQLRAVLFILYGTKLNLYTTENSNKIAYLFIFIGSAFDHFLNCFAWFNTAIVDKNITVIKYSTQFVSQ